MVLDANYFAAKLPESIEAIYYHTGVPNAQQLARDMARTFARKFGRTGSQVPPVLAFDASNWDVRRVPRRGGPLRCWLACRNGASCCRRGLATWLRVFTSVQVLACVVLL